MSPNNCYPCLRSKHPRGEGEKVAWSSIQGISPRWGFRIDDSMLPRADRPGLSNLAPLGLLLNGYNRLDLPRTTSLAFSERFRYIGESFR